MPGNAIAFLWRVLLAVTAAVPRALADSYIADGSAAGFEYDGHGALSAGASSR